jgi:anti-sigma regulatory factor (Ser/Thr protein kinase)
MSTDEASVTLTIPARTRYLRLARLTAAGIASDLGFSVQGIEDLRVAVDEACAVLIDGCADSNHKQHEVELHYLIDGDRLLINGVSHCGPGEPIDVHPVARELLGITSDEHEVFSTANGRAFRLTKRRKDTDG